MRNVMEVVIVTADGREVGKPVRKERVRRVSGVCPEKRLLAGCGRTQTGHKMPLPDTDICGSAGVKVLLHLGF